MASLFRHASEGWHLTSSVSVALEEKRDPSFRWDDGVVSELNA
ncbi:hypothetical protein [Sphingobium scionense]|uniref:Uncharacterized protein n=1 Tax=Sphingobium scionense TaxID=1404341 RepID=A0A7W6PW65_9SPHN|nr:hypothetical protein [Sphingobium scionense]MBB4147912.1 hypothetical protein [Sphingobium scionense]